MPVRVVVLLDCEADRCGRCRFTGGEECGLYGDSTPADLAGQPQRSAACRSAEAEAGGTADGPWPWQWMLERWNEMVAAVQRTSGAVPPRRLSRWTADRQRHARARLRGVPDVRDAWGEACELVRRAAEFFHARRQAEGGDSAWRPDVDWVLREEAWARLHEGRYSASGDRRRGMLQPAPGPAREPVVKRTEDLVDRADQARRADRIRDFRRQMERIGSGG